MERTSSSHLGVDITTIGAWGKHVMSVGEGKGGC